VQETNIAGWAVGTKINLEVDVIARYLERLLLGDKAADASHQSGITTAFLAENGFMK
jgi:riboflavin synthase